MPALRIGEFARRVGVPATSLRAWERRYGLLSPARSAGGFRLYAEADAERVVEMQRGLQRGLSAAEAAAAAIDRTRAPAGTAGADQPAAGADQGAVGLPEARQRLLEAISAYDDAAVHAVLDDVLAAFGLETFLIGLVLPVLASVGGSGEQDESAIGQEHFASNLIRARLLALARFWGRGAGPLALLACVSGEYHDISLIAFGLLLRTYGWRVVFLGADTPPDTIRQAVVATQPTVTVLSAFAAPLLEAQAPALRRLAQATPVLLSGPASSEAVARRLHMRHLVGDLVRAAAELAEAG